MKTFLIRTTTLDRWELCGGSYLVNAESKEEAKSLFEISPYDKKIYSIEELDLSVKGQIEIQESMVE
jgi:hypothetical protein